MCWHLHGVSLHMCCTDVNLWCKSTVVLQYVHILTCALPCPSHPSFWLYYWIWTDMFIHLVHDYDGSVSILHSSIMYIHVYKYVQKFCECILLPLYVHTFFYFIFNFM